MVGAAAVGAIAGARRGGEMVEKRAETELKLTISAQTTRITLLESQREELEAKVTHLEAEVARLSEELSMERKISARITVPRNRPQRPIA
jgi:uncharacterized protein involved in exopolysaccharide biosynthesis